MARIPVPLVPKSDHAKSTQGGGGLLTNCYIEATQFGKTGYSINTDPGLTLFSLVSSGNPCRGWAALGNNVYAVFGETAYKIASSGVATSLGTVLGQKFCIFSANRKSPNNQITITADTKNYYIENDVLTEVTDADLPAGVNSNAFLNGRTIYFLNTGVFYISDDNSTEAINALNFAEAESSADQGVRVFVSGSEIWFFGAESLEIWRDTGDATFPFSPLQGASQGKGAGCIAKNSVALSGGSVIWVSDEKRVVRAQGYQPVPISPHDVERDIETACNNGLQDEIVGFAWEVQGHRFYHIRCSLWCWVYDETYDHWHKKADYLGTTWKCGFYLYAFNKHLVASVDDGKVYEYTFDAQDEDNDPLISKIETSPLNSYPDGHIVDAFHVDIQSGVGRASGAAHEQDPQMILECSADGGMTWGLQRRQAMGAQGKWATQARFNRLGSARGQGMVFRLSFPEPVERAVFQAAADVRKLSG